MATRSTVAFNTGTEVKAFYVHWDGAPEWRMPVLRTLTAVQLEELAEQGHVSSLEDYLEGKPFPHRAAKEKPQTEAQYFSGGSELNIDAIEFCYYLDAAGAWWVSPRGTEDWEQITQRSAQPVYMQACSSFIRCDSVGY
jgi:hypothetical protein